jgi:hypothetical protein
MGDRNGRTCRLGATGLGSQSPTPGIKVKAVIHPLCDGNNGGQFMAITIPGEKVMGNPNAVPSANAPGRPGQLVSPGFGFFPLASSALLGSGAVVRRSSPLDRQFLAVEGATLIITATTVHHFNASHWQANALEPRQQLRNPPCLRPGCGSRTNAGCFRRRLLHASVAGPDGDW